MDDPKAYLLFEYVRTQRGEHRIGWRMVCVADSVQHAALAMQQDRLSERGEVGLWYLCASVSQRWGYRVEEYWGLPNHAGGPVADAKLPDADDLCELIWAETQERRYRTV